MFELFFGVSEKILGVSNGLVAGGSRRSVHVEVVLILWEESVAGGSGLSVVGFTDCHGVMALNKDVVDHIGHVREISLSGHVKGKLRQDGFSKWVGVDLGENVHVLFFG